MIWSQPLKDLSISRAAWAIFFMFLTWELWFVESIPNKHHCQQRYVFGQRAILNPENNNFGMSCLFSSNILWVYSDYLVFSFPRTLATYNSLTDKHLVAYFSNTRIRRHLQRSGLVGVQTFSISLGVTFPHFILSCFTGSQLGIYGSLPLHPVFFFQFHSSVS